MRDFESLSGMLPKYAYYDIEGKRIYLDQMEQLLDRLKIFNMRASLTDDPIVKGNLQQLAKQLLFLETNQQAIFDGKEKN